MFHGGRSAAIKAITEEDPGAFFESIGNRTQILIFTALTLVLTALAVWGISYWVRDPTTLTFAVGPENGIEAQFAAKLATVLKNTNSGLHVVPVTNSDSDKMIARFDHRQADLTIIRTDAKAPDRARAIAILDTDVMLFIGRKGSDLKNLRVFAGKKVAVIGDDDTNEKFLRQLLTMSNISTAKTTIQTFPSTSDIEKLLAPGANSIVVTIEHLSKIAADKSYEKLAQKGFVISSVDEAKAIERKLPGASDETLEAGLLSTSPLVPDDDLEAIGLQWLLVAQSSLSEPKMVQLARDIYDNKSELGIPGLFADTIKPADTDKDAYVMAHAGAAEYINDNVTSWIDRYSDLGYLGAACLSIIGSIFVGLYSAVTKVAPEKAGELSVEMLDIGEKVEQATSLEQLDALQDEFESVLRRVLNGLRDGTISSEGLETFRLGYDFVRSTFDLHRQALGRQHGRDHATLVPPAA